MTKVSFHFNVPDRLAYVCRLLRKATRLGAGVVVVAPTSTLADLDRVLWTFDALEFVPHLRLPSGAVPAKRLAETPVWLVESVADAPRHDVLLNLDSNLPAGYEAFARVIEVVTADAKERAKARERWKQYAARGDSIERHEVAE
jgi:DNA polymerase-3 subunit chi